MSESKSMQEKANPTKQLQEEGEKLGWKCGKRQQIQKLKLRDQVNQSASIDKFNSSPSDWNSHSG